MFTLLLCVWCVLCCGFTSISPRPSLGALKSTSFKSVGIDLGTTFSAISYIQDGRPRLVPVDGQRIMPSVVSLLPDGSVEVGAPALKKLRTDPKNTYYSAKRLIGRSLSEVLRTRDRLSLLKVSSQSKAVKSDDLLAPCEFRSSYGSGTVSPVEISKHILIKLLTTAEKHLNQNSTDSTCRVCINKAVITVPAYFSPQQCDATEAAGLAAGLSKVRLLREPEAAAMRYGLNSADTSQIVLVFDLGGGTFDVSVLDAGRGLVEVIATSGDPHLGGDDIDELVAQWMFDRYTLVHGDLEAQQLRSDPVAVARVYAAAERLKIVLTTSHNASVSLPNLHKDLSLQCSLTRTRFEAIISPVLQRLLRPLREVAVMAGVNLPGESGTRASPEEYSLDGDGDGDGGVGGDVFGGLGASGQSLQDARSGQLQGRRAAKARSKQHSRAGAELRRIQRSEGLSSLSLFPTGRPIGEVVMVGGSSRIPAVQRVVAAMTGIKPRFTVHPDEAVALGAGVMAGILDGEVQGMCVVTSWKAAVMRVIQDNEASK